MSKKYNAREEFNKLIKYAPDPTQEEKDVFDHIGEIIEEAINKKIKVYVFDPFKPGSTFEIKRIHRGKQIMHLQQPQIVAQMFHRAAIEIAKTYKLYTEQVSDFPVFFTETRDFLNLNPVTIIQKEEIVKKEQVFIEKNSGESIKKKDISKELKKLKHAKLKQYSSNFHFIIDDLLTELHKWLKIED